MLLDTVVSDTLAPVRRFGACRLPACRTQLAGWRQSSRASRDAPMSVNYGASSSSPIVPAGSLTHCAVSA